MTNVCKYTGMNAGIMRLLLNEPIRFESHTFSGDKAVFSPSRSAHQKLYGWIVLPDTILNYGEAKFAAIHVALRHLIKFHEGMGYNFRVASLVPKFFGRALRTRRQGHRAREKNLVSGDETTALHDCCTLTFGC